MLDQLEIPPILTCILILKSMEPSKILQITRPVVDPITGLPVGGNGTTGSVNNDNNNEDDYSNSNSDGNLPVDCSLDRPAIGVYLYRFDPEICLETSTQVDQEIDLTAEDFKKTTDWIYSVEPKLRIWEPEMVKRGVDIRKGIVECFLLDPNLQGNDDTLAKIADVLETGLGIIPLVGEVLDGIAIVTGKNILFQNLSCLDKVLRAAFLVIGVILDATATTAIGGFVTSALTELAQKLNPRIIREAFQKTTANLSGNLLVKATKEALINYIQSTKGFIQNGQILLKNSTDQFVKFADDIVINSIFVGGGKVTAKLAGRRAVLRLITQHPIVANLAKKATTIKHIINGDGFGGWHLFRSKSKDHGFELIGQRSVGNNGVTAGNIKFMHKTKGPITKSNTFFPDNWNEEKVADSIQEAFSNRTKVGVYNPKTRTIGNTWVGTSNGVDIQFFVDENTNKIISAFPAKQINISENAVLKYNGF